MEGSSDMDDAKFKIEVSRDEALVLFALLKRVVDGEELSYVDQAEQRVIWDLESSLESLLLEPLDGNYEELLRDARDRIRDVE